METTLVVSWFRFLRVGSRISKLRVIILPGMQNITNYNLSHVGPQWAAFMYRIYTCHSSVDLIFLFIQNINHGPKWNLIHRSRDKSIIRPLLYHQATTARFCLIVYLFSNYLTHQVSYQNKRDM